MEGEQPILYRVRGFRTPGEAMAYEDKMLLDLTQKRLYQPTAEQAPEGEQMAPVETGAPRPSDAAIDQWRNDPNAQRQLLRSSLKTLSMTDEEVASFLSMASKDLVIKMNKSFGDIARKLANRKAITAVFLRQFVMDFFKIPNYGFYEDEV